MKKKRNSTSFPPFLQFLGIFLSNAWSGTGTSYASAVLIFKIQVFILMLFINLASPNATKKRMRKYNPQKFLSNNAAVWIPPPPPLKWPLLWSLLCYQEEYLFNIQICLLLFPHCRVSLQPTCGERTRRVATYA